MGEDDRQIGRTTLTDNIDQRQRGTSSFPKASGTSTRSSLILNPKSVTTTKEPIITSQPSVVSKERIVSAATTVMAAGPSATISDLLSILGNIPHSLPLSVAEGIVVGARFAASSVASWRLDLAANQHRWMPASQSAREALSWWAREPEWSHNEKASHRAGSSERENASSISESEALSSKDVDDGEDEFSISGPINQPQLVALEADREMLSSQPFPLSCGDINMQSDKSDAETSCAEEDFNKESHESPARKKKKSERRAERRSKKTEDRQELTKMREMMEAMERRLAGMVPPTNTEGLREGRITEACQQKDTNLGDDSRKVVDGATNVSKNHNVIPKFKIWVHSSTRKSEWSFVLDNQTRVLIIADSNMRSMTSLPPDWEAHVFPGARFGNMINALEQSLRGSHPNLEHIIIQVGINHRGDREVPTTQLKSLLRVIHTIGASATYVGISYAYDLPGKYRMNLDALNDTARGLFDNYIKPLHPRDVTLRTTDKQLIHHDDQTVNRILQSIVKTNGGGYTHAPDGEQQ